MAAASRPHFLPVFSSLVLLITLLQLFLHADADGTRVVEIEVPHSARVGQKLYRNAPWLRDVDLKTAVDGRHEWFSLVKDKGDRHLLVNGHLHRLAGRVLRLELLHSGTGQLARELHIFISPPAAPTPGESPALKYLATDSPPATPAAGPAPSNTVAIEEEPLSDPQLSRVRRQSGTRVVLQASENTAPGSLLFTVVTPSSPAERYVFNAPPPEELSIDPATSKVYLRMNMHLNFASKPSILFSVLVQTADGRGLYRVLDFELQVQKSTVELSPVISKYTTAVLTTLYRETETLDGAMLYRLVSSVPGATTEKTLTYGFIPGMESRAEGRFRVVPDLGLVVTQFNDAFPGAPKFYDMGVRAINMNSTSPLTKYGYSFVRVFTTYQPPEFSEDAYTFYLTEESGPVKVGQVLCQSINNMWSVVTITSRMRPNVAAILSMDSNGTVNSLVRLDYDVPTSPKVWYFTAICTENATSTTPRSSEVEVAVQLLDINDNRPYFFLEYYVKPTATREDLPVNTEVFRVPALDSDSPPNSLLIYTLSGPNSELFNVTRDPVTLEAIIRLQSPMDYEALPSRGKEYKFTITVSDGVTGSSSRPSSTVVIGVQNVNDNAPIIRNFTSEVDKNSPAGTNVVQMQVTDRDGSNINYYFWTGTATTSQFPSTSNNMFTINQVSGMVSIGTVSLSSLRDATYIIPYRAIDDGTCDSCPVGTPLSSQIGYLTLTVTDSGSAAPVFINCPTTPVSYTDNAPAGTQLYTIQATASGASIEYALVPNTLNPTPGSYFLVNSISGMINSSTVIDIDTPPVVTLRNYFWLTVRAVNVFNSLASYCSFQLAFQDINDEVPVFDSDSNIVRVIDLASAANSMVGEVCAFDPDVPGSPMSTVEYFIVESNPPAGTSLFTISSSLNLGTIRTAGSFSGYIEKSSFALTIEARNPVPLAAGTTKTWKRMTYTVFLTNQRNLLPPIVGKFM